jgi:hypothetical protein
MTSKQPVEAHQHCPACGTANVDFLDVPGAQDRRSQWQCSANPDHPQWTGPDLTMADAEDDDGTGIQVTLTSADRIIVAVNSYGHPVRIRLTAADARLIAARLTALADDLALIDAAEALNAQAKASARMIAQASR